MSTVWTRTPAPEQPQPAGRARGSVPFLVGAGVLVVAVVAMVLLFGVERPPALTAVRDAPDPGLPQEIAWTTWGRGNYCIQVARTDGGVDEVWCDPEGGELVGWTGDGNLVVRLWEHGDRDLTIDRHSGEVLSTDAGDRPRPVAHGPGPTPDATSYRDRGDLVVEVDGIEIWRVTAPDTYQIRSSTLTADGRWVALVDSADRLLVARVDGDAEPRVWATDVSGWDTLVWQDSVVTE